MRYQRSYRQSPSAQSFGNDFTRSTGSEYRARFFAFHILFNKELSARLTPES